VGTDAGEPSCPRRTSVTPTQPIDPVADLRWLGGRRPPPAVCDHVGTPRAPGGGRAVRCRAGRGRLRPPGPGGRCDGQVGYGTRAHPL